MADSDDARALRTRAKLLEAFHELVGRDEPEALSVSQITRVAGVNRTSFYAHFSSPDDLAVTAIGERFAEISGSDTELRTHGTSAADAARAALEQVVAFVLGGRDSYARLLVPGGSGAARLAVEQAYAAEAERAIANYAELPAGIDIALAARYGAAGVMAAIGQWLATASATEPAEALVDQLYANLPSWMTTDSHRTGAHHGNA